MTTKQSRPDDESRAAEVASLATPSVTEQATEGTHAERPRCLKCGHPLTAPRSLARAYGPKCWARQALVQVDRRRDSVGRKLRALAARVGRLDLDALAVVAAAVDDVLDALDGSGVTA